MRTYDENLAVAGSYVLENAELREAIGLAGDAAPVVHALAQGEHNANYWFEHPGTGKRYVLRVCYYGQLGLDNQIAYEAEALRALRPSGRVAEVYYVDESDRWFQNGALVMEYCAGGHLDYGNAGDLREAARMMADVHAVRPDDRCGLIRPASALADLYGECQGMFARYRGSSLEDPMVSAYVDKFFSLAQKDMARMPDLSERDHILNTELVQGHFLIPEDGAPGHIVDWDKPIIGEVTRDLAYFLAPTTTIWQTDFIFTPEQRSEFVERYWAAVGGRFGRGSFDERFPAYTRMNCLRGITWSAMAWVDYHDPAHLLKNELTFERLGVYLSEGFLSMLESDIFAG